MRAGGAVRYVRVSTRTQILAAAALGLLLIMTFALAVGALWREAALGHAAATLSAQRAAVSARAAKVQADRRSVDSVVEGLEQRQDALDALMRQHFGEGAAGASVVGSEARAGMKTSSAADRMAPGARLAAVEARQARFAQRLANLATARIARAEAAFRDVGLNPRQFATGGRGGPFEPAPRALAQATSGDLAALASLLDRLSALEAALSIMPSARPTTAPMESSSYGYRRDPFNGQLAFHAGIDFPGRYGQPILAASDGKVVYAGPRAGYGNCLEIDHGHGIVTRYAHLSRFTAGVGEAVKRGKEVARMGSTGRSTGTHLHFEVRVRGQAMDPRRFLEAPFLKGGQHVLEVRQVALRSAQRSRDRS